MEDEIVVNARARLMTTLGKYQLESLVGVGGMAAVYVGRHRNGHRVAVKVLHPQLAAFEATRRRFLREGYVANTVGHPNAVRVLDDVDEGGVAYLVMELLEGETLDARLERMGGRLPAGEVAGFGCAILEVLEAAHKKGIVHRDLKPENLFLTSTGELKVLDFGIARLDDPSGARVTKTTSTMGTPAFLSPEQALGHSDEIDARTDLWAVGATLYTLLTGRHVHDGITTQELLIAAATRPARPLRQLVPDAPAPLATAIDVALRFARADRWPDAAAMRRCLLGQTTALPSSGHLPVAGSAEMPLRGPTEPTVVTQKVPPPKRTPWAAVTATAVGTAAIGVLLGWAALRGRASTAAERVSAVSTSNVEAAASSAGAPSPVVPLVAPEPAPPTTTSATAETSATPVALVPRPRPSGRTEPPKRNPTDPPPRPAPASSAASKDLFDPR